MMEILSKSKSIKKKHKKRKIRIPGNDLVPLIMPGMRNGESNWMKLQKVVEPVKRESSKKDTKGNMLPIAGINPNDKDYKPPFTQKANSRPKVSPISQVKRLQISAKSDKTYTVQNNCNSPHNNSINSAANEHSKVNSNRDKHHSFEFNFNSSSQSASAESRLNPETVRNDPSDECDRRKLTKAVAMDCEMVGTGPKGDESIIARVSIVNSHGDCLYDEFVKPKERVTDFRTKVSGVRPSDLKNGKDLFEVQKAVLSIIEGRTLVGHSIKHDLDVLFISHPRQLIRDTAFYKPFREICGGKTPSLKKLTSKILGCEIQSGEHSSVEDAQAAMLLYLRHRREWESLIKSKKRKPKMIENKIKSEL